MPLKLRKIIFRSTTVNGCTFIFISGTNTNNYPELNLFKKMYCICLSKSFIPLFSYYYIYLFIIFAGLVLNLLSAGLILISIWF